MEAAAHPYCSQPLTTAPQQAVGHGHTASKCAIAMFSTTQDHRIFTL